MIVDQPNTIGVLPIAVARSVGIEVAYLSSLSSLAMRRAADLYRGSAKTDARDAFVIADAARTIPHTLRRGDTGEETRHRAPTDHQTRPGYDRTTRWPSRNG